jgi:hypothetical protein
MPTFPERAPDETNAEPAGAPATPRQPRRWVLAVAIVLVCAGSIAGALVGSFPAGAGTGSGSGAGSRGGATRHPAHVTVVHHAPARTARAHHSPRR